MGLWFLGLILLLVVSWWIGWRVYWHLWLKQRGEAKECFHCGRLYRGDPTYCPHCGEVVARWSSRR
jgi:hypothetical protein